MVDRIVTGKDVAQRFGLRNYELWVLKKSAALAKSGRIEKPWRGEVCQDIDQAVKARIDFGRWIADCPDCGGAEYVDPGEAFFFCLSCGNEMLDGKARQVIFPENREEIEVLVLERPVKEGRGGTVMQKALLAKPQVEGFSRSWAPDETVGVLEAQNQRMKECLGRGGSDLKAKMVEENIETQPYNDMEVNDGV